jgi:hypothetical protein
MKAVVNDPVKIASLGIEAFETRFLKVGKASRLTLFPLRHRKSKPGRLAYSK